MDRASGSRVFQFDGRFVCPSVCLLQYMAVVVLVVARLSRAFTMRSNPSSRLVSSLFSLFLQAAAVFVGLDRWSGRGFLIDQKNCFYRRLLHWHWSRLLLPSSNLNSCVSICLHTHWMSEWMQQWLETWLVYIIVCLSRRRRRRSGGDWWIWLEMGWRQLSRVCVCVIVGMHGTTWWHSTQYANTNIANCGSLERWFGVVSLLPGNEDRQLIF